MTRAFLPLIFLTSLAPLSPALDKSGEEAKQALQTALEAEDEARLKSVSRGSRMSGTSYMKDLERKLEQGVPEEIDISLERITKNYPVPAITEAAAKLRTSLAQESKRKEDAELEVIDTLKKEVREAIPKAATAKDLDSVLERLESNMNSTSDYRTDKVTDAIAALVPLKIFTSGWQDYLLAKGAGEEMKANQILHSLSAIDGPSPVPRSIILSRIIASPVAAPPSATPPEKKPLLSRQLTELDQITAALGELQELRDNMRESPPEFDRANAGSTIGALSVLEKTYQDFKAGLPTDLTFLSKHENSANVVAALPNIAQLEAKLLLLVLPTQLGLQGEDLPKPGETVAAFLNRVEKAAAERGDATVCVGLIDARLALYTRGPLVDMDRSALSSFRAAQAKETAGQTTAALVSYQVALNSGPGYSLATLIGKRLEELKRIHPEEFRKALERYQ